MLLGGDAGVVVVKAQGLAGEERIEVSSCQGRGAGALLDGAGDGGECQEWEQLVIVYLKRWVRRNREPKIESIEYTLRRASSWPQPVNMGFSVGHLEEDLLEVGAVSR